MQILVADDNDINLKVACAYLKALSVDEQSIHIARDGDQAVSICDQHSIDLVFMDIQMPKKNGIEATQEILQVEGGDAETAKPVVVALTANTNFFTQQEYSEIGIELVLYKPVTKDGFKKALDLIDKNAA